jgi:PAS domain S-box-containing protein
MPLPNENIAAIHERWFSAYNARDVDGMCAVAHPHIELAPTRHFAPPGTSYHGHAGIRSLATHTFANFPAAAVEGKSARSIGDWTLVQAGLVLAADEPARDAFFMFRFEDGLIRRIHGFDSEGEALESGKRPHGVEFRSLFDGDPLPIILIDDAARLVDLNPAACTMVGLDRAAAVGRPLVEFIPEDRQSRWRECWDALRIRGQASGAVEFQSASGDRSTADFWASAHYTPGRELALLRVVSGGRPPGSRRKTVLTPREREIFQLLALGFNAPQIAERLFLSPLTVRTHVQNGMARLGAGTRVQAIAIALARQEIQL